MNSKVEKIRAEIEKNKEIIIQKQARIRELERQLTEAENVELVMAIRSINAPPEKLLDIIAQISKRSTLTAKANTKTEDQNNET